MTEQAAAVSDRGTGGEHREGAAIDLPTKSTAVCSADVLERSPLALAMLCAWNNIPPDKAPPEWWNHPSDENRLAWERVAQAARDYIAREGAGSPAITPPGWEAHMQRVEALRQAAFADYLPLEKDHTHE